MNKNTCILLFLRSAACESKHKQLANVEKTNCKIHQAFLNRTYKTIGKTKIPLITVGENRQKGDSFGERFYHALSLAFAEGYENVIAVGADCPGLTVQDILNAEQELMTGHQCLGPSKDGGIYLLGISKTFFQQDFVNLSWQTDSLYMDLQDYFLALNALIVGLIEKHDVDNATQFNILYHFLSTQLGFEFLNNICEDTYSSKNIGKRSDFLFLKGQNRRGPPNSYLIAA